eukprot:scaffold243699_cov15-Tisochrysis_lutea.AAC.1
MSGFWAKGPTATTTSAATSLNVHTGKISVVGGKRAGSNNKAPAAVPQHEGTQGKSVHGWERPGGITNKSASAANVPAAPCCLGTQNTTHGRAQTEGKAGCGGEPAPWNACVIQHGSLLQLPQPPVHGHCVTAVTAQQVHA